MGKEKFLGRPDASGIGADGVDAVAVDLASRLGRGSSAGSTSLDKGMKGSR